MVGTPPPATQQRQRQEQQQQQQSINQTIAGSPQQLYHQDRRIPHLGEPFEPGLQQYCCVDAYIQLQ